jgi:hypothetical protein
VEILQRTIDEQRVAFRASTADEQAATFTASGAEEEESRRSALWLRQEQDAAYLELLGKDQVETKLHVSAVQIMYMPCFRCVITCKLCQCRKNKDPPIVYTRESS